MLQGFGARSKPKTFCSRKRLVNQERPNFSIYGLDRPGHHRLIEPEQTVPLSEAAHQKVQGTCRFSLYSQYRRGNIVRLFKKTNRVIQIAKASALAFNPNVNIVSRHQNIKEQEFSVDWFRGFDLVMNALDNLGMFHRNHYVVR